MSQENKLNKFSCNVPFNLISACSLGTILEWYDFSLYAYVAPTISTHFFPNKNQITSIMLVYSIFAVGFIVRPLGAILFGHFGDREGRKKALVVSMLLMASMTCVMCIVPTYKQIGLMAPALLIIVRILQGIAIGGETIGAGSLIIESVQNMKRGFPTALIWASSGIGILLCSVVVALTTMIFSPSIFTEWAWRIPFALGGVTGLVGIYFRNKIKESAVFRLVQVRHEVVKTPFLEAISKFKKEVLITIGLYALCAITLYLLFVFMPVYASKILGLPFKQVVLINSLTMAFMILLVPIAGYCSDIFGRKIVLLISASGFLILSYPVYLFTFNGSLSGLVIAQSIFAIFTAGFHGPVTSAVLEMFPSYVRYSAVAVGYNVSYSLFGATTPLIAVYLVEKFENNLAPSFYLSFGALLAIFAIINMKETYKAQLS
ncbi:MAG: MFS transporter [Tatlockia sp.]|nr:MFS transporter [Tatlockia sp.]